MNIIDKINDKLNEEVIEEASIGKNFAGLVELVRRAEKISRSTGVLYNQFHKEGDKLKEMGILIKANESIKKAQDLLNKIGV